MVLAATKERDNLNLVYNRVIKLLISFNTANKIIVLLIPIKTLQRKGFDKNQTITQMGYLSEAG